jgi:hypothetical protein
MMKHMIAVALKGIELAEKNKKNIEFCIHGHDLCVLSTATIGLLSSVQGQLAVASAEAEEQAKEVDYSNIWTPKKFLDVEYWFLKTGKSYFVIVLLHSFFIYFLSFFLLFLPPLSFPPPPLCIGHETVFWTHFDEECNMTFKKLYDHFCVLINIY